MGTINSVVSEKSSKKSTTYVVIRDGFRVSDKEYDSESDPDALSEFKFWYTIATKHSYGEPVEIVKYDAKLHRVW